MREGHIVQAGLSKGSVCNGQTFAFILHKWPHAKIAIKQNISNPLLKIGMYVVANNQGLETVGDTQLKWNIFTVELIK